MRTLIVSLISLLLSAGSAWCDVQLIVPQRPGGGTSVWAVIVAREVERFLGGERVQVRHLPGARDIPGFNIWHNELRADDATIMVSHGGNAVAFLEEPVEYDYRAYEAVGFMNLNIVVALRSGVDPEVQPVRFASEPGSEPEAYAMAMLLCGPMKSTREYVVCFKQKVVLVKAMSTAERRLAFQRKELTATRENPAAFKKFVTPMIDKGEAQLWFHHGVLDLATGSHKDDVNFPGKQFETLYEKRWGAKPDGEFYAAYKLMKSFRDVLQKALWVRAGNPNTERLRDVLRKVATDKEAIAAMRESVGNYDWVVGKEANAYRDMLMGLITEPALRTLVEFNSEALGLPSKFKPELVK